MEIVADGVAWIGLAPSGGLNTYLLGETTLVDTGLAWTRRRLERALDGRSLDGIVLTHAHIDHAGAARALATAHGCRVRCGRPELEDLRAGVSSPLALGRRLDGLQRRLVRFPGLAGDPLDDGDEVGHGFVAVATPGHSPGHRSLWRERDRVLITGDALFGISKGLRPGVHPPFNAGGPDHDACVSAIRRLAELRPDTLLFGHGPPVTDRAADRLATLAERLA